jgi:hypothetical protein
MMPASPLFLALCCLLLLAVGVFLDEDPSGAFISVVCVLAVIIVSVIAYEVW